eukprot:13592205-Alexandrium_andersonii.AAC.1
MAVSLFSLLPTGHSVNKLLREVPRGASPGGLPPPWAAPAGASGASGLTGRATAPPDHPKSASGAQKTTPACR